MLRRFVCLVLSFLLAGCMSMHHYVTLEEMGAKNSFGIMKLKVGMSQREVFAILKNGVTEIHKLKYRDDYPLFGRQIGEFDPAGEIRNPYKVEALERGRDVFEVLFYYVDYKMDSDGIISEKELTPLVFKNKELIGWGWSFYREQIAPAAR